MKVNRIVAAVDVGVAVNPAIIRAQVEGSVGSAPSAVLRNRATLKDGVVQERNFDTDEPTRMSGMPVIEVHIVSASAAPTGIGEPGVPVLAPAVFFRDRPAPALAAPRSRRIEGRVRLHAGQA